MSRGSHDLGDRIARSYERRAKFIDAVHRFEALARTHPAAYERRVMTFAVLGYAYLLGVVLLLLGVIAASVAFIVTGRGRTGPFWVALGALSLLWAMIRALRNRWDDLEGVVVARDEAPELFRVVGEAAAALRVEPPETILLSGEVNAAAAQIPRLGVFGWYRTTLVIGAPLFALLDPNEGKAVIAHEMGHFSGQHGRFGVWVYRVQAAWDRLHGELEARGGSGQWLFSSFALWYVPKLSSATFGMRRAHEYQADQAAAQVAGADAAASGLAKLAFLHGHVDKRFWSSLKDRIRDEATPPARVYEELLKAIREPVDAEEALRSLRASLAIPTSYDDSHPSKTDRLTALGGLAIATEATPDSEIFKTARPSALEVWLGDGLDPVIARLSAQFVASSTDRWAEQHAEIKEARSRLAELEEPGSDSERVERARLTVQTRGFDEAEAELRAALALDVAPFEAATVRYLLGANLLDRGEEEGVELLNECARLEQRYSSQVHHCLGAYFERRGDATSLQGLRDAALEFGEQAELDEETHGNIQLGDELAAHDLDAEQLEAVRTHLAGARKIARAYIVRRPLPSGRYGTVIYVFSKSPFLASDHRSSALVRAALEGSSFDFAAYVYSPIKQRKWEEKLSGIEGALVFDRRALRASGA